MFVGPRHNQLFVPRTLKLVFPMDRGKEQALCIFSAVPSFKASKLLLLIARSMSPDHLL